MTTDMTEVRTAFHDVRVGQALATSALESPSGPSSEIDPFTSLIGTVRPCEGATLTGLRWTSRTPVALGAKTSLRSTVTRCQSNDGKGFIGTYVQLLNDSEATVQEAWASWDVPDVGLAANLNAVWDVGSIAWTTRLAERLASDPEFVSTTKMYDGSIGLRSGETESQLRIYRGRILEVTRKVLGDSTFTVEAGEDAWYRLLSSPRNDYVKMSIGREIHTRGDGYQYLRMHKAVMIIIRNAREMIAEDTHA